MSTTENLPVLRMEFAAITIPDGQALLDRLKNDIAEAREIEVDSEMMAEEAQEIIGRIASGVDTMEAERLALTLPLRNGQAWVNAGYKPTVDSLQTLVSQVKVKLQTWNRQVAAAAQKKADEAKAEAKKKSDLLLAEANQKIADAAKLKSAAEAAQAEGNTEAAAELFAQAGDAAADARDVTENAHAVATTTVHTGFLPSSGVKGARKAWKGRVLDKQALLLAAANRPELRGIFDVNESALNAFAKLNENNMHVPGVEFYEDESIAVKRR